MYSQSINIYFPAAVATRDRVGRVGSTGSETRRSSDESEFESRRVDETG